MPSSFIRCGECDRLSIYGATCVCGHRTDTPTPEARDEQREGQ